MKFEIFLFLFLSVILGVSFMFLCFKVFKRIYLNILGIGENLNLASAILLSSLLFSIGLYISFAMVPIRNMYAVVSSSQNYHIVTIISFVLLFLFSAVCLAFIINFLSFKTFDLLTNVNEAEEIVKNNIPIAVIVSTIIIVTVLITKESFVLALDSLIPYPELPYK